MAEYLYLQTPEMIWSNRNHWSIGTMNEPATIREILDRVKTIAVVGLTNKEGRASHGVSRFMQSRGYRIIPVNPLIESALGEKAYATLDEAVAAEKIDLVNVFRLPEYVPAIVE